MSILTTDRPAEAGSLTGAGDSQAVTARPQSAPVNDLVQESGDARTAPSERDDDIDSLLPR